MALLAGRADTLFFLGQPIVERVYQFLKQFHFSLPGELLTVLKLFYRLTRDSKGDLRIFFALPGDRPPRRRRKVRSALFPPAAKTALRSLAPPLQTEPAVAGLRFGCRLRRRNYVPSPVSSRMALRNRATGKAKPPNRAALRWKCCHALPVRGARLPDASGAKQICHTNLRFFSLALVHPCGSRRLRASSYFRLKKAFMPGYSATSPSLPLCARHTMGPRVL